MTTASTRHASAAAVCDALGVPEKDWPLFYRWAATPLTPKATDALHQYVDVMIADRCRLPADDLMTKLITLEVDGRELTVDDIRSFVSGLVAGSG
jgi:cytochrome P450